MHYVEPTTATTVSDENNDNSILDNNQSKRDYSIDFNNNCGCKATVFTFFFCIHKL